MNKQNCKIKTNIPIPPTPPSNRNTREGSTDLCACCGSSLNKKYLTGTLFQFGPIIGCIQPKCKNYYNN